MASPGKKSFALRIDPVLWAEIERLAAQGLDDEVADDATVPGGQARPVAVEEADDADRQAALAVVRERHRLGDVDRVVDDDDPGFVGVHFGALAVVRFMRLSARDAHEMYQRARCRPRILPPPFPARLAHSRSMTSRTLATGLRR